MKLWVYLIVGAILFFALMSALSQIVGLLFWIGVAGLVIGGVSALISGTRSPRLRPGDVKRERRIDTAAEQALQELEQKVKGP